MKKYLMLLSMISNIAFAYNIPPTTLTNRLGKDLRVNDIWTDQGGRPCDTPGIYIGQIWSDRTVFKITGSCPDTDALTIVFEKINNFPEMFTPGIRISKNRVSVTYTGVIHKDITKTNPTSFEVTFGDVEIKQTDNSQVASITELKTKGFSSTPGSQ